jgi:hypothetical protein
VSLSENSVLPAAASVRVVEAIVWVPRCSVTVSVPAPGAWNVSEQPLALSSERTVRGLQPERARVLTACCVAEAPVDPVDPVDPVEPVGPLDAMVGVVNVTSLPYV